MIFYKMTIVIVITVFSEDFVDYLFSTKILGTLAVIVHGTS